MRSFSYSILILVTLAQCAQSLHKFPVQQIIPSTRTHTSSMKGKPDSLNMLYLGCGNLILRFKDQLILTDPFFSTQGITKRKIKTSLEGFKDYCTILHDNSIDLTKASSIWLAHTHYDHMMDVPMMLKSGLLSPEIKVYGNSNGDDILTNFLKSNQYQVPEDFKWIQVSEAIRVMVIPSNHAPHLKVWPFTFHFMKGKMKENYFAEKLKTESSITKRKEWKEGKVYSFLIDFIDNNQIAYRVFIQTSASTYPLGIPPDEILDDHPIDVAALCLASSNTVKPYPVQMLKKLTPSKIVFIHWEDFFLKPLDFKDTKLVRFTNFKKIKKRLDKARLLVIDDVVMPKPGTMITFQ